jgi:hypothetical protein
VPLTPARIRPLRHSFSSTILSHPGAPVPAPVRVQAEAVVELHEESAAAFQDFLFWAYPHLDCKVSWTNVEPVSHPIHPSQSQVRNGADTSFSL